MRCPAPAVLAAIVLLAMPCAWGSERGALSLEDVAPGKGAWEAGLRPGDRPLSVRAEAGAWPLDTVWDWMRAERCLAPRGPVEVTFLREGQTLRATLGARPWGVLPMPPLRRRERARMGDGGAAALEALGHRRAARGDHSLGAWLLMEAASLRAAAGETEAAAADAARAAEWAVALPFPARAVGLDRLATYLQKTKRSEEALEAFSEGLSSCPEGDLFAPLRAELLFDRALLLGRLKRLEEAETLHREALELREAFEPDGAEAAVSRRNLGLLLWRQNRLEEAAGLLRESLSYLERWEPEGFNRAAVLTNLGVIEMDRGELAEAERLDRAAAGLWAKVSPGSLSEAAAWNNLGAVLREKGDLDGAQGCFERALAIRREQEPGGLQVAASLNNLGAVAHQRGELPQAQRLYEEALAIKRALAPDSPDVASALNNLGTLMRQRGDLGEAERLYGEALAIWERTAPGSLTLALVFNNLGALSFERGDLDTAEQYHLRALDLRERLAPESTAVAQSLQNLGDMRALRGDYETAQADFTRARDLFERLSPDSVAVAAVEYDLGAFEARRGDPRAGVPHLRRSAELLRRLSPSSLPLAETLSQLGEILARAGDGAGGRAALAEALQIQGRFAPGSISLALTLQRTGDIERRAGRLREAADRYGEAVAQLEAQVERLGGTREDEATFRAAYGDLYQKWIEALAALGRPREAFAVLERSRARVLLDLLAERDLVFAADLPAELERQRRHLAAEHEGVRQELASVSPEREPERAAALATRLGELAREQASLRDAVRAASPRLAALRYPEPLDAGGALAALEPGTLALAYAVGEERTLLFALGPGPGEMRLWTLPLGRRALTLRVRRFRSAVQCELPDLEAARALGGALLGPAAPLLARCHNLIVVPDGPLHILPFAALVAPGAGRLVERTTLTTVLSLTLYAQLSGMAPPVLEPEVFADPSPTQFPPLPHAREEAVSLQSLFPRATVRMGEEATEAQAKRAEPGATALHFACHGLLDTRFPLESCLALAPGPGGGENGLLRAWEVFEDMRTHAPLVVLSSCDSALGRERQGEGLVGLTRAFQHAGAVAVLASLWPVDDAATARLMARFYGGLKRGLRADEALREAQGSLAAEGLSPACWAAFALSGRPPAFRPAP